MHLQTTPDQDRVRKMVHDFLEAEVRPIADKIDESGEYPEATVRRMAELGLLGINVPEEHGGAGLDAVTGALVGEEMSRVCRNHAGIMGAHNTLACGPIVDFGTPEQKQRFLPDLASGKAIGSYCLTEPHAGSDPANMKTKAEADGDEWVLTGSKCFISNARVSGTMIVFARSNDRPGAKGVSAFIVPTKTEGITIGADEKKLGLRAQPTNQVDFDHARIPKENLLGKDGEGFKVAMKTLDNGRISVASGSTGVIRACREESTAYAKERKQFGRPISDYQAIQWKIADMATHEEASRLLYLNAAWRKDHGLPFTKEASMAKVFASEKAMQATIENIQVHGGNGFMMDYPAQRHFRDIKVYEIFEGTSEIQRMVISRHVLT
ncbi:MAG: acyl-CoA dehydrogenase family protein [Euryarchaeota archaeon]|nr:acyl-CoA dehydrogenase family protein [Euryarchaeota archaeon]